MSYQPLYRKEDLLLGKGNTIIVTGWTPKERVQTKLESSNIDYGCIGSLYNPFCGLSPLVANLVANPVLYPIHILNCTKQDRLAKGSEALKQLLRGYYVYSKVSEYEQRWDILSSKQVIGEVDGIFTEQDLQSLCSSFHYWTDLKSFYEHIEANPQEESKPKEQAPKVYLIKKSSPQVFTGQDNGVRVEAETIAHTWVKAMHAVYYTGQNVGKRRELLNLISVIKAEPEELYTPDWLVTSRESILEYCYDMLHPKEDKDVEYTYGERIFNPINQVESAVRTLIEDPDSNRAVVSLWIPQNDAGSAQPPCLTQINLKIFKGKLILTATFRSHDIYTAYCSNLTALRYVQETVCQQIRTLNKNIYLSCGDLVCISQAAHIYEWSLEKAKKTINEQYQFKHVLHDDVGNFVISLKENGIEVTHTCPKGSYLDQKFYPLNFCNPLQICREIALMHPTIKAVHLAYLALELERAVQCSNTGQPFAQDKSN
jgi:thymidylate synthase